MLRRLLSGYVAIFSYNRMTLFGASLATVSASMIVFFVLMGAMRVIETPYLGILTFMMLPGVFVAGLLAIFAGGLWEHVKKVRRARQSGAESVGQFPVLDFNVPHARHVGATVAVLTAINVLILSAVSYRGVVYSDSSEFCGKVCHKVMEPEYTAYVKSPHSRVHCAECHIGPGASWFARSKLSGVRQILAVAFDTHSRPIDTPVHNLRPSKETCEQCHWPKKFAHDRFRVIPQYLEDEDNTLVHTVLVMRIGGGHGEGHGIHSWHIDPSKVTTYLATDEDRQEIPLVRVTDPDGNVTEYKSPDFSLTDEEVSDAELRTMDCMDCHNRPAHVFEKPDRAVDKQMTSGGIDATLPYIKKVSVEALTSQAGEERDLEEIARQIRSFYQEGYPEVLTDRKDALDTAILAVQTICEQNIFPYMKVTWGTYTDNIGHADEGGCFRCHDDSHETEDGNVIRQDCNLCHVVLAWEEENPEVLAQLEMP